MSKRHASSKAQSQRPVTPRYSSPLKRRKATDSDATTYASDSSTTKLFASDKGTRYSYMDVPSDACLLTSTDSAKKHIKSPSKKQLAELPLSKSDEIEMDDLCPVCDDHCTCNRVSQKATPLLSHHHHHHHNRNESAALREAYHFTPVSESSSEESTGEDTNHHHVYVYASPRSRNAGGGGATAYHRSSDEDRIISELAYAEDPFDSIDYYMFSNESEEEEYWNTAQKNSSTDLPSNTRIGRRGYEEDIESSEYSDHSAEDEEDGNAEDDEEDEDEEDEGEQEENDEDDDNDDDDDDDDDEEIENQIIKDEEKMITKSLKSMESSTLLSASSSCSSATAAAVAATAASFPSLSASSPSFKPTAEAPKPAIQHKKKYASHGKKGDAAEVRKTLSTIDKELLLEALKQMSPDVLSSISKNLKKNKKDKQSSSMKEEMESIKDEPNLPTSHYTNAPPTIIDNNANPTTQSSFMHSMSVQKSEEPGWIVRDYSAQHQVYSTSFYKNSEQAALAYRFVENDTYEFEAFDGETSLNFEDVLDTDACPISFSKDAEPSPKVDPVSRWDRIPIGTFRRSRRLSVPLLRYTNAFKDPGSNHDPWINGAGAQPQQNASARSHSIVSSTSSSSSTDAPCYYEQVTAWCLLADNTGHLCDEILLVDGGMSECGGGNGHGEGDGDGDATYFTGLERESDYVSNASNSLYTCGGHVDSSPEPKADFSLLY